LECTVAKEVWQELGLLHIIQPHLDKANDFNKAVFEVLSNQTLTTVTIDSYDNLEYVVETEQDSLGEYSP